MNNIAVIYTTFLRTELMQQTLLSVLQTVPKDVMVLVGDQDFKNDNYVQFKKYDNLVITQLPYDCGVSYARNVLIEKAHIEYNCEFIILSADSIKFTPKTWNEAIIEKCINVLRSNEKYGIIGLDLENREPWEYSLRLEVPTGFIISKTIGLQFATQEDIDIRHCDICRNFLIAKTKTMLIVPYDNDLKTGEHEDFFYRFKQAGYVVGYTKALQATYVKDAPAAYFKMRKRLYHEFSKKLMIKYKINKWVIRER